MSEIQIEPQSGYSRPLPRDDATRYLNAARGGDAGAFEQLAEPYRRELLTHCYRMSGSLQEAEDLVQETFLRAWRRLETYEGRASFRAWLYKISTNVCLDALDRRPKRSLPTAVQPPAEPGSAKQAPVTEPVWLEPYPDELLAPVESSPEARYVARESITLSFMVALQLLSARQRCVLILSDVLDWHASEIAEHLGVSLSTVNSLLYRARTILDKHYKAWRRETLNASPDDERTKVLLDRYVHAWEAAEIDQIIDLLKEDASFPMPPVPSWYHGRQAIREFIAAVILNGEARGRWRLVPVKASGQPAFAWYQKDENGQGWLAFAIQVLTFDGELLSEIITFTNAALFRFFSLPLEMPS